uniref:Fc receptor like A n=1 Tax=Rhinolophus ferrumequinum TaxID=59479 RepID=A0A671F8M6_RHIFE
MLKTIRVFEAARELLAATMDLGGVLAAWAPFSPAVLWTAQMLLVASSETLQCEGPASTRDSSCHTGALEDPREKDFQVKGYTFSAPFHLVVAYGPPSSAAPPALSPAPQESAAPGTTATDPSEPPPASPPPSSEGPGQSCPLQALDPHLHHQMGLLLKQMQDVTALLGHLVVELRDLSGRLKLETSKGRAKY